MYLITVTPPEKPNEYYNLCESDSLPKFHSVFREISGDTLDYFTNFNSIKFNFSMCVEEDSKMADFTDKMSQASLKKT